VVHRIVSPTREALRMAANVRSISAIGNVPAETLSGEARATLLAAFAGRWR